eukprot:489736-Rhodomonas_salina.1
MRGGGGVDGSVDGEKGEEGESTVRSGEKGAGANEGEEEGGVNKGSSRELHRAAEALKGYSRLLKDRLLK